MRLRKQIDRLRCVICGSDRNVERNHVGGRNHIAWFTMPFCREHHEQFHALLRSANVNLEYVSDSHERFLRAINACLLAQWIFTEALQRSDSETAKTGGVCNA